MHLHIHGCKGVLSVCYSNVYSAPTQPATPHLIARSLLKTKRSHMLWQHQLVVSKRYHMLGTLSVEHQIQEIDMWQAVPTLQHTATDILTFV